MAVMLRRLKRLLCALGQHRVEKLYNEWLRCRWCGLVGKRRERTYLEGD